ncbi:DUF3095 domain-containing protein [Aurantimonas sp. Leaf443]|uniref:DUF3095 domain-containing protein n=1 Tax=Aurantimonas sp. Leaf443 TaxID=1736378 RepID=UPI0006F5194B|nr:DUF3095 domain-containing protein [Aurantimonas sp. Leaf443]KQT86349.1 adenylate cyclase [Aurantimonas sp. Leaf443]
MDRERDDEASLAFYESLPAHTDFSELRHETAYAPLPPDWIVGVSDIVDSTGAVEAGRYKSVNTAAAAVIAALSNALKGEDFPFVFAGDGASFALPGRYEGEARGVLASVAAWVSRDLGMVMRVAVLPVSAIRRHGFDVRVARHAPSPDVAYAMFSGGGLAFAEARMKAGDYAVDRPATVLPPDLSGLNCRFAEIAAQRGVILSVIALPAPGAPAARFDALIGEVLRLAGDGAEAGSPVPAEGPRLTWPPSWQALTLEARARRSRSGGPLSLARLRVALHTLFAHILFVSGLRVGAFDPARYRRQLVANTDFRKFDDGLRMTLDCTPATADAIERRLAEAEREGIALQGTHRQDAALMTCFVPSASRSDHVHFVDGATGGYSAAAAAVKAKAAG